MRCGQTPRFYHKKVPVTVRDSLEQVVSRHVLQELFQKEWLILPWLYSSEMSEWERERERDVDMYFLGAMQGGMT